MGFGRFGVRFVDLAKFETPILFKNGFWDSTQSLRPQFKIVQDSPERHSSCDKPFGYGRLLIWPPTYDLPNYLSPSFLRLLSPSEL